MNRDTAFELFGKMRYSTPEEQKLYRNMLNKLSIPIKEGENIFDMSSKIENNTATTNTNILRPPLKPIIIAICGKSASGKNTLVK